MGGGRVGPGEQEEPRARRVAKAVRTAAALVVVAAIVAGAIVVRREAGGVAPVEARATAVPEAGATAKAPATAPAASAPETPVASADPEATAAVPAKPTFAEVLADAKAWAAAEEWDLVVGMLSENGPAWTAPKSFEWNTLLARAALLQAQRLPKIDGRRNTLIVTAHDRATLALASVEPFAKGADLLRLLRAEACIIGELECESSAVTEDLLLAARSPHVAVSERAVELLESVKP